MLLRLISMYQGLPSYRHTLISLTDKGTLGPKFEEIGVPVYALGLRNPLNLPIVLFRLWRLLRTINPDIVQTTMYHADFFGGIVARLAGLRKIIWCLHSNDMDFTGSNSSRHLFRLCARFSSLVPWRIISVSQSGADIHRRVGYDASKLLVIPNGFDVQALDPSTVDGDAFRQSLHLPEPALLIGLVARFNEAKDIQTFVKAACLTTKTHPNAYFVLIGAGLDPNNKQLATWIAENGLTDRIRLCGERQDIPQCLKALDLFMLSSRTEAFPTVIGEAMAMEKPCVATNVGDAAYLIDKYGSIAPPADASALAAALERLLDLSPEERKTMGQGARQRIQENFSKDVMLARYQALYDSATDNGA